jgi:hypothetical protein
MGDRHHVAVTAQHERCSVRHAHPDRAERAFDDHPALAVPPEQPGTERPQRRPPLVFSDQGRLSHADLDPGLQRECVASRPVAPKRGFVTERTDEPSLAFAGQLSMKGQDVRIVQVHGAAVARAEPTPQPLPGKRVAPLGPPLAQLEDAPEDCVAVDRHISDVSGHAVSHAHENNVMNVRRRKSSRLLHGR